MNELINKLCGTNLFLMEEKENLEMFLRATPLDTDTVEYLGEVYEKIVNNLNKDIVFFKEFDLENNIEDEDEVFNVLVSIKNIFVQISIFNTTFKMMGMDTNLTLFTNLSVELSTHLDKKLAPKLEKKIEGGLIGMNVFISNYCKTKNITDKDINNNFFYGLIR